MPCFPLLLVRGARRGVPSLRKSAARSWAVIRRLGVAVAATVLAVTIVHADSALPITVSVTGDYYMPKGSPSVGDLGFTYSRSISRWSPSVVVAWDFSSAFSLEAGYRHIPEMTCLKWGPPSIFPTAVVNPVPGATPSTTQIVSNYSLANEGDSGSLGVAYRVRIGSSVTLSASVFGAVDRSHTTLTLISPAIVLVGVVPISSMESATTPTAPVGGAVLYDSSTTSLRPGARLAVAYRIWRKLSLRAEYEFLDSTAVRGSYVGGGLSVDF